MGVRFRDDVMASVRLLAGTDRWVAIDLIAGIAGYVVWVAGSAALGLQVASLAEYDVAPGGSPTPSVLGLLAVFWLVLPAALGVARVRSRLLNIRNNVEQAYRLDRPAALLVPPGLLVVLLLVGAVAMGTVEPLLFVVLAPATLLLLVRTIAYSYRVYAFSHPVIPYASLFGTLVVQAAVLLAYIGVATQHGALVRGTISTLSLPIDPLATTTIADVTAPIGPAVAVAVPIVLVVGYLLGQTAAAILVRVRKPVIQPRELRTGQRYPPWLEVASSATRSTGTPDADTSASGPSTSSTAATVDGSPADSTSGTSSKGPEGSSVDTPAPSDDETTGSPAVSTSADVAAEEAESVSHTRVFTPPDGGGDDPLAPADGGEACPDCGTAIPANAEQCPACGAEAA